MVSRHTRTQGLEQARRERGTAQRHIYARGAIVGKVTRVDPGACTADIAAARGQDLRDVPVLMEAGTRAGSMYLQAVSTFLQETGPEGPLDDTTNDLHRTVYAVVDFAEGNPDHPYVVGFLMPRRTQMRFAEAGLALWRHESDAYTMVRNGAAGTYDADSDTTLSDMELVAADGTYIKIGTGSAHADLTSADVNGLWSVRGTANAQTAPGHAGPDTPYLELTIKHASGFTFHVDATGHLTITLAPSQGVTIAQVGGTPLPIARQGDPVVDGGGTPIGTIGTPVSSKVQSV